MSYLHAFLLFVFTFIPALLFAQIPRAISYQGVLTDSSGNPTPDGVYPFVFRFYNAPSGGAALWSESENTQVKRGLFSTQLGDQSPFGSSLDFTRQYWMSVQVGGSPEMSPRIPFNSVAYSFNSISAETSQVAVTTIAGAITTANLSDFAVTAPKIASSAVDSTKLGTGSVTSTKILNGSINTADLANSAITVQKVAHGNLVKSLNGLNDTITISGANGTTVSTSNDTLYINSPGGGGGGSILGIQNTNNTLDVINPNGPTTTINIKNLGVGTGQLTDNSVTAAKIASAVIDSTKLTAGSVTSTKILDGGINTLDLANSSVTTSKVSSSGASSGQAIIYNGSSVAWGNPTASNLTLPFSGAASSSSPIFSVTNNGSVANSSAIYGLTTSTFDSARAIHGVITGTSLQAYCSAVRGENKGTQVDQFGVWGSANGLGYGVFGTSTTGYGVYGKASNGDGGVIGQSTKVNGSGIIGIADQGSTAYGVWGQNADLGAGVYGYSFQGAGIYGTSINGYAGKFVGNVQVTGTLSKGAGSFKIDHPLDPANKYLYHSFVESPDMKNIYDGVVTLNQSGEATVQLPGWFSALNRDFRYQLTAVGAPGPNLYIAEEISSNTFRIAGGSPGMKVSWQVTGIRHDVYAEQNRIPVEQDKTGDERGHYLYPQGFGMPEEAGVNYSPEMKSKREKLEQLVKDHDGKK